MREITVAAIQMSSSGRMEDNIAKAAALASEAADKGAKIILLQELFRDELLLPVHSIPIIVLQPPRLTTRRSPILRNLQESEKWLCRSVFSSEFNPVNYNSLAVIDASGEILGIYHKSHIPERCILRGEILFCSW